ncbi:t42 [Tupaiid betaherpesvirus 1]|uniref:T42 n=1 Tax=Tupaiid herpesvirus 1 (strain 1) TaxID=10397 RepID=Q91TQ1_TUHV1|nr:t42 [Tupaiid betaherpesvirus 1]AAK57086.1 t42 [Tupaiid betaherpesvirus 1]
MNPRHAWWRLGLCLILSAGVDDAAAAVTLCRCTELERSVFRTWSPTTNVRWSLRRTSRSIWCRSERSSSAVDPLTVAAVSANCLRSWRATVCRGWRRTVRWVDWRRDQLLPVWNGASRLCRGPRGRWPFDRPPGRRPSGRRRWIGANGRLRRTRVERLVVSGPVSRWYREDSIAVFSTPGAAVSRTG